MDSAETRLKELWQHALAGSESAYRELLTILAARLRTYVQSQLIRLGRSDAEADDIVQETLLAIHGKRHTFDGDVPIMAWVFAITRHKMIDFLRASERAARAVPLEDIQETIGTDANQMEIRLSVRSIFSALPEKMRQPIGLMKLEGLSTGETATMIGISEAAVRVNVHRGLKMLARAFKRA